MTINVKKTLCNTSAVFIIILLKFEQEIKYISEIVQPWSMLQIIIVELTASQLHSETGFEPVPAFLGNSVRVYCSI